MGLWSARARQADVFHFNFLHRQQPPVLLPWQAELKDVIAPLSQPDTVHDKKK